MQEIIGEKRGSGLAMQQNSWQGDNRDPPHKPSDSLQCLEVNSQHFW
jgi:hypothetical protein